MSTQHTVKSAAADIQSLTNAITTGFIIHRQAQQAKIKMPPLLQLGIKQLN